jgi:hypothetical protein
LLSRRQVALDLLEGSLAERSAAVIYARPTRPLVARGRNRFFRGDAQAHLWRDPEGGHPPVRKHAAWAFESVG